MKPSPKPRSEERRFEKRRFETVRRLWYKFSLNPMSVVGLAVVLTVVFLAVFQPLVAPYPGHEGAYVNFKKANIAPCREFLLGSDTMGRDILSRILYAFRGALTMGIGVLAVVVPVGGALGLLAGYYGGTWVSTLILRITDVFLALPPLILALCVGAILKPTLFNSMMAMCVSWWPWYTRLVFGMAMSAKNEMYVKSAELLGASRFHIVFREILPNCMGPIFTKMTLDMGWVILMGASLSFVGLGEQPPIPALGTMVSDGAKYIPAQWWISIFPALAIMLIVLGFNFLGDGVKDMLSSEG
jgi:peptide/nickel transport system permease protein